MPMGGKNELHSMFYQRLRETIDNFGYDLAIRPIEFEANIGDTKWENYIWYPQRYFILPCPPLGLPGIHDIIPIITCGFLIMSRYHWYQFNGLDERYDVGCGWWDNDLLDRLYLAKIPVVFDQKLMIYRHPHVSAFADGEAECKEIYKNKNQSISAPNDFKLDSLHNILMQEKQKYVL